MIFLILYWKVDNLQYWPKRIGVEEEVKFYYPIKSEFHWIVHIYLFIVHIEFHCTWFDYKSQDSLFC